MEDIKTESFKTFPSVIQKMKEEAPLLDLSKEELMTLSMLFLLSQVQDAKDALSLAFRDAVMKARRANRPILDQFKHSLLQQQRAAETAPPNRVAGAIGQTRGKGPDHHTEAQ